MIKRPAQRSSAGIVQLLPLLLIAALVVGALLLQSKGGQEIFPLKRDVLSESESGGDSSGSRDSNDKPHEATVTEATSTPKPTEVEDANDDNENEVEDENENEVENEQEFEVESGTEGAKIKTKIKIRNTDNRFQLTENETEAETNFPLSVDSATRELKVTTPAGVRIVAILPRQAVDNMLAQGTFDLVLKSKTKPDEEEIEIEEEAGRIVYKITGANQEKVLGIFNVLVPRTVAVSAETGESLGVTQSLLSRLLDLISF